MDNRPDFESGWLPSVGFRIVAGMAQKVARHQAISSSPFFWPRRPRIIKGDAPCFFILAGDARAIPHPGIEDRARCIIQDPAPRAGSFFHVQLALVIGTTVSPSAECDDIAPPAARAAEIGGGVNFSEPGLWDKH